QDLLGGPPLLGAIVRPIGAKLADPALLPVDAEEIFEPVFDERVAFHVEEEIARRRLWQPQEALVGLERPQLEGGGTTSAARRAQLRLDAEPGQCLVGE